MVPALHTSVYKYTDLLSWAASLSFKIKGWSKVAQIDISLNVCGTYFALINWNFDWIFTANSFFFFFVAKDYSSGSVFRSGTEDWLLLSPRWFNSLIDWSGLKAWDSLWGGSIHSLTRPKAPSPKSFL
jgi:hypothetical protein